MSEQNTNPDLASRRHLLKLGAMAAPAVITLAPASARAAVSTLHCFVPVEQAVNENGQICTGGAGGAGSGSGGGSGPGNSDFGHGQGNGKGPGNGNGNGNVPSKPGNPGRPGQQPPQGEVCYGPPSSGGFTAQQIQNGFGIDGISDDIDEYRAYTNYLQSLRSPTPGASCMVSINMTGR